ncbi:CDP-glucose 4,6-dehydratase [Sphingorhabdus arenilitoris]|uniref:CDP-glucose 4,6-dehydratase n=1 Tax=Sphingorhabdus arenilitoris TaxID=1490041 RepID=A0ABV8RD72_9SPHN
MSEVACWKGRNVLISGHTGFKGSWLTLWLHSLGANITGFSLPPPTKPSLFEEANIAELINHIEGDVRDLAAVDAAFKASQPSVVFHLAAQPLVRLSYDEPVETYSTNVMGTVNFLDAARRCKTVDAVVSVTSDKCYENREWIWPYRENDPMGGHDPYSSSKGCAELVISAYRNSFFPASSIKNGGVAVASVRAGNVIGGGDWATDRLIPDIIRAFQKNESPVIRSPNSVRPWQHVLEALGGYIQIAERLIADEAEFADGWNFGPADDDAKPVSWIVEQLQSLWSGANEAIPFTGEMPHEAGLLRLDCSKAYSALGWRPRLPLKDALQWIVDWSSEVGGVTNAREATMQQIEKYRQL